ncbi:MAG: hypothetical protein AAF288_14070 [Planctomycetota bacterium]
MVPHSPSLRFAFDPRVALPGGQAMIDWGPSAVGWLHAIGVLAAAAGVWVAHRAGARLGWRVLALVLAGMVSAGVWFTLGGFEDRQVLAGWVHAASAGLAVLCLGQLAAARAWLIALLLGLAAPTGLDAVYFVAVDGPAAVRFAQDNAEQLSAARGQEADSSSQRLLSRRTATQEATGTVGFSNVLGAMSAGLLLVSAGCTLAARRRWGLMTAAGLAGLASGVALVCTSSRGAMAAAVGGLVVMAGLAWLSSGRQNGRRWGKRSVRWLAWGLPVGLIVAMQLAVVVSGWLGAGGPGALRSLLFRAWYLETAVTAWWNEPSRLWTGWGVRGLGEAVARYKPALLPEEVASLHHAAADWVMVLGAAGLGWAVLLIAGAMRAGRNGLAARGSAGSGHDVGGAGGRGAGLPTAWGVGLVTLGWFGAEYAVAHPSYDLGRVLVWLAGAGGFVLITLAWAPGRAGAGEAAEGALSQGDRGGRDASAAESSRGDSSGGRGGVDWVSVGLAGAASAVVAHGLTEMTWFRPTSVPGVAVLVALAAAGRKPTAGEVAGAGGVRAAGRLGAVTSLLLAVLALWVAVWFAFPAGQADRDLADAERLLRVDPVSPGAIDRLDRVVERFGRHRVAERWSGRLRLERVAWAAGAGRAGLAAQWARGAVDWTEARAEAHPSTGAYLAAGDARRTAAGVDVAGRSADLTAAAAWYGLAVEASPGSVTAAQRWAGALEAAGRPDEAAGALQAVLERDGLRRLDPERQLRAEQRAEIESRIARLEEGLGR